jgi:hypothetical protein
MSLCRFASTAPCRRSKHVKCSIRDEWLRIEVLTLPEGKTVVVDQKLFQVRMRHGAQARLHSAKLGRCGHRKDRHLWLRDRLSVAAGLIRPEIHLPRYVPVCTIRLSRRLNVSGFWRTRRSRLWPTLVY